VGIKRIEGWRNILADAGKRSGNDYVYFDYNIGFWKGGAREKGEQNIGLVQIFIQVLDTLGALNSMGLSLVPAIFLRHV